MPLSFSMSSYKWYLHFIPKKGRRRYCWRSDSAAASGGLKNGPCQVTDVRAKNRRKSALFSSHSLYFLHMYITRVPPSWTGQPPPHCVRWSPLYSSENWTPRIESNSLLSLSFCGWSNTWCHSFLSFFHSTMNVFLIHHLPYVLDHILVPR